MVWGEVLIGLFSAGGGGGIVGRYVKNQVGAVVDEKLAPVLVQFGPNGGGLRQAVNELSDDVGEVKQTVARIEGGFNEHVRSHTH